MIICRTRDNYRETKRQKPRSNPFGDRLVFFTDPAGNLAQIVGRVEPLAL
jgi:hypothetical protein